MEDPVYTGLPRYPSALHAAGTASRVCAMRPCPAGNTDIVEEAEVIKQSLSNLHLELNRLADQGLHGLSPRSMPASRRASLSTPSALAVPPARRASWTGPDGCRQGPRGGTAQGAFRATTCNYWDDPLTNKEKRKRVAMMHAEQVDKAVDKLEMAVENADQLKEECSLLQSAVDRLTAERKLHFEPCSGNTAFTRGQSCSIANHGDMEKQQLISLCSCLYVGSLIHRLLSKGNVKRATIQDETVHSLRAFKTHDCAEATDQHNTILMMEAELQHAGAVLEAERAQSNELKAEVERMNLAVQSAAEKQDSLLKECAMLRAEADARQKSPAAMESKLGQVETPSVQQHAIAQVDPPYHAEADALHERASQLEADLHEVKQKLLRQQEEAHQDTIQLRAEADAWHQSSVHLEAQLHEVERNMVQQQVNSHQQTTQLHAEADSWHKSSVKLEAQLREVENSLLHQQQEAHQDAARLRTWQESSAKLENDLHAVKMLMLRQQEEAHDETARFLLEQATLLDEAKEHKEALMNELTMSENAYGKLQVSEESESCLSLEYAAAQEQALARGSFVASGSFVTGHETQLEEVQDVLREIAHLKAAHEEAQQHEAILTNERDTANSENNALCTSLQHKAAIIQEHRDSKAKLAMQLASSQEELSHVKAQHQAVCFEKETHKDMLANCEEVLHNTKAASRALEERHINLQTAHTLAQRREVIAATERDSVNSENGALRASVQHKTEMLQEARDTNVQLGQKLMCCQEELAFVKASWSAAVSECEASRMHIATLEDSLRAEQDASTQEAAQRATELAAREVDLRDSRLARVADSQRRRWTPWLLRILLQMLVLAAWSKLEEKVHLHSGFGGHVSAPAEAREPHEKLLSIQEEAPTEETYLNAERIAVQPQPPITGKAEDVLVNSEPEANSAEVEQAGLDYQKAASQIGSSFWFTPRRACRAVASATALAMATVVRHAI